jgi:hypothetical protein
VGSLHAEIGGLIEGANVNGWRVAYEQIVENSMKDRNDSSAAIVLDHRSLAR